MKASYVLIGCLLFSGFAPAADEAPGETTVVMTRTIVVAVKAALTMVDNSPSGAIYKGLAISGSGASARLYGAIGQLGEQFIVVESEAFGVSIPAAGSKIPH